MALPHHRATTAHLGAAYPFMAQAELGGGVYIGRDLHGGAFHWDVWHPEVYQRVLTSPNVLVVGQLGKGKSSMCKAYVARQLVFGRRAVMLDPKGENGRLCELAGVRPIRLEPAGTVRLNPLDRQVSGSGRDPDQVRQDQLRLLHALIGASLRRELTALERTALREALAAATERADAAGREPTLNRVAEAALRPAAAAAERAAMGQRELADGSRDVGLELSRLCEGDLAGMFDGETTVDIDFSAPLVSLDLSAVYDSEALGILMVCAGAWLERALLAEDRGKRILVMDEAWATLSNLAIARWLASSVKLARKTGVQIITILHRLSDLTAAGAAGSEQVELAKGLLRDTETQVVYAQSPAEVANARDLLGLTDTETELIPQLPVGVALWRVGSRRFLVQHRLSPTECWMVDTDAAMR